MLKYIISRLVSFIWSQDCICSNLVSFWFQSNCTSFFISSCLIPCMVKEVFFHTLSTCFWLFTRMMWIMLADIFEKESWSLLLQREWLVGVSVFRWTAMTQSKIGAVLYQQFAWDVTVDGYHSLFSSCWFFVMVNRSPLFFFFFCETKTKKWLIIRK